MTYVLRYTPEAMRDMDDIWHGVYETTQNADIADKYVNEFADAIVEKKRSPFSGIPLNYRGLFTGFYSVTYNLLRAGKPITLVVG